MPTPEADKVYEYNAGTGKKYEVPDIQTYMYEHSRRDDQIIYAERDVCINVRKPEPGEQIKPYPVDKKNPDAMKPVDPNNYIIEYDTKKQKDLASRPYEATEEYLRKLYDVPKEGIGSKPMHLRPKEGVQRFIQADRDLMFYTDPSDPSTRTFVEKGDYINITDKNKPSRVRQKDFPLYWNTMKPDVATPLYTKSMPQAERPNPTKSAPDTQDQDKTAGASDRKSGTKPNHERHQAKPGTSAKPQTESAGPSRPMPIPNDKSRPARKNTPEQKPLKPKAIGTKQPISQAERSLTDAVLNAKNDGPDAVKKVMADYGMQADPILSPDARRAMQVKPMQQAAYAQQPATPGRSGSFTETILNAKNDGPKAAKKAMEDYGRAFTDAMLNAKNDGPEAVKKVMEDYGVQADPIVSPSIMRPAQVPLSEADRAFADAMLNAKQDGPDAIKKVIEDHGRQSEYADFIQHGRDAMGQTFQFKDAGPKSDAKLTEAVLNAKNDGPAAADKVVHESGGRAQYASGLQNGRSLSDMGGPDAAPSDKLERKPGKAKPARDVSDMSITEDNDSGTQVSM